ncbi:MAG: BatA domain-containing protein, partial [Bacteroidota bacterium]|nr:BatA domain-containing protein [Bacteroidota bacterium]
MNFVHPYFLFALAAIAIPIIIHLFNFRRYKTVHFTNVKFIEQIKQKTKKQSRLKELIVLILRILAVASIVIAFAQPYIPLEDNVARHEASTLVSVYIDNSFSMQAKSKAGSLLEEAKKLAEELAMAYRQSDVFHLLTNDFERKNQRLVSRNEFIEALDEISYSPAVRELSEVLSRQEDFLFEGDAENRVIFMVSDFQASIVKFDGYRTDTNNRIFLVPVLA